MSELRELQKWYQSQCDGEWEHGYGLKIETLDNPGWKVTIELSETEYFDKPFSEVARLNHETDWIHCRVQEQKFEGCGGPLMLEEILSVFLVWTQRSME